MTCDRVRRRCSVESDRAEFEHLRLEDRAAVTDLLSTGLTAAGRMASIVREQTLLLCVRVDSEQEEPVEQIEDLVDVERDAADEHGRLLLGQQVLEPRSIPNPAVCPEPLLVPRSWSLGL